MEDLPYVLTRDYLVDLKYRLGLKKEAFEAEKDKMTDEAKALAEAALKAERRRINELDRRFAALQPRLKEYYAIVHSKV